MSAFPSFAHVAVTVTDLERSTEWYRRLFGAEPVLDEPEPTAGLHHTVFVLAEGTLFGLHLHDHPSSGAFDERRAGLDHISFACADRAELDEWADRLDALGVRHGGVVDAPYGAGLSFRDPDGIALEFFAAPA